MDSCLLCLGFRKDEDREYEPLLPKHRKATPPPNAMRPPELLHEGSTIDKIINIMAALNVGKLPTQDQLSHILQVLLKSELLREDEGRIIPGNGPASKQGRKVIGDVRDLLHAFLQFGMEKNADDKLQDLYFQLLKLESPIQVDVDTPKLSKARDAALSSSANGASKIQDEAPTKDELAFDATTVFSALRTLAETFFSSSAFRLILGDILAIFRDIVAHTAADVQKVAQEVQQVAQGLQESTLGEGHDITDENGYPNKDAVSNAVNDVKDKGKQTATKLRETAKQELQAVGNEATSKTRDQLLRRIRKTISKIQRDPASRSALQAILTLAKKYSTKITSSSESVTKTVEEAISSTTEAIQDEKPNYPPRPYPVESSDQRPFLDVHSDAILQDIKEMLQRIAKGHPLDGLLSSFVCVVQSLNEMPAVVSKEVEDHIDQDMILTRSASSLLSDSASQKNALPSPTTSQNPEFHGKPKRKNGKARKRQKTKEHKVATAGGLVPPSPISASTSQDSTMSSKEVEAENAHHKVRPSRPRGNPVRVYFSRLGEYLDQALDEPGWATSKEGENILQDLFIDGVELLNIVGESVICVEEQLIEEQNVDAEKESLSEEDKIRRRFKMDLKDFIDNAEAYISAVEHDKTTMKLFHVFETLGADLKAFSSEGAIQGKRSLRESIARMHGWTTWVGWAIPRLLRLLPASAIPIPSIEFSTPDIEGALQAVFIQGLARGDHRRRTEMDYSSCEPVAASLVPDEVVLKEWTEVRIDMADYDKPLKGCLSSSSKPDDSGPGVQTTTRLRMHVDGVRARVEGMGYYFKYKGGLLSYEDEGIVSVDVGMGALHEGLGADVEIEIENESLPFTAFSKKTEEHDCARPLISEGENEIMGEQEELANIDIQTALRRRTTEIGSDAYQSTRAPAPPLFNVVDVNADVRGLRLKIDESKHWILNKLFIQSLAGPVVTRLTKHMVERKIKESMEHLAAGLGEMSKDAHQRREKRRLQKTTVDSSVESEDGLAELLRDWWGALLKVGPTIFGRSAVEEGNIQTETDYETTSKGIIYKNTTTTITSDEPGPSGIPATVVDPVTNTTEQIDLSMKDLDSSYESPAKVVEEETVIAVGAGAQLFPGKAGAYGVDHEAGQDEILQDVKRNTRKAAEQAKQGVERSVGVFEEAESRWERRNEKENNKETWQSDAFNF